LLSRPHFSAWRVAGAAYLTYLGLRVLFHRSGTTEQPLEFARERPWAIYRAGFLTNLLNPKMAVFFLAFLPQFVAPSAESKILAFLFLGGVFMSTGTMWCLLLAWFGSAMSRRVREHPSAGSRLRRASGALFVGLGVRLALSK
jgi:threonine/homoserine/homoserine lactone efflux protein